MKTQTKHRPMVCWSIVNGSTCLCIQCWSCKRKMKYRTKKLAEIKASKARQRTNSLIKEYSCTYCGYFHIGHVGRR